VSAVASYAWEILGPPVTTITSGPPALTSTSVATFTFTADQAAVTFECSLDGEPFSPCSSPVEYDNLVLGQHRFEVQATNSSGLLEETPAVYEWTIEPPPAGTPPDTLLTSSPAALTASPEAIFSFAANIPGSTFTCALDGASPTSCTSPVTYTNLAAGPHTFTVQATSPLGIADPTPATFAWTIDTAVQPTVVSCGQIIVLNVLVLNDLTDCPGHGLVVGAGGITIDLGGRVIDGSGLVSAGTGILNDGFDGVTLTNGTVQEFSLGVALLNDTQGNQLSGLALNGNLGSGLLIQNSSQNLVENNSISGLVANPLLSSDVGVVLEGASVNTIRGNTVTDTGDAGILLTAGSNENNVENNLLLRSGDAGITVEDSEGNDIIGNTAHEMSDSGIALDGALDTTVRGNDVRFNPGGIELFASLENLVELNNASSTTGDGIALDGDSIENIILLNVVGGNGGRGIAVLNAAAEGSGNLIENNQADGNGGDGVYVAAPGHTITANSANNNGGWGIYAAAGNTDGGGNTAGGNGQAGQCFGVVCGAGTGGGTFQTTLTAGPPAVTTETGATFDFTASVAGSTFECSLDGAPFAACVPPVTFTGLAEGEHTFQVRAVSPNGIVDNTPASYTWLIEPVAPPDITPPTVTIVTTVQPTTISDVAIFELSASELSVTYECALDSEPFGGCTSPVEYNGLDAGVHTFQVRATDAAGNLGPVASFVWEILDPAADTVPPDTEITAGP
ncbi:MAG TPA: right-handed parallel beta-helix repeat-containing protein, partial [Acidimicrobiales bacterium]|nr:right-handed parallel beta-helix repeat-containing protein [Acidimicrobiales bacterium]